VSKYNNGCSLSPFRGKAYKPEWPIVSIYETVGRMNIYFDYLGFYCGAKADLTKIDRRLLRAWSS